MKVKLGFFYDAWKVLADWIKGESSDKPKVEVDGGTIQVSNWPTTQQVAGEIEVTNLPEVQQVTVTEPLPVSINGNNMTLYGADISERPAADSVPVGATFTIANADLDTWISNGTDWVVI